MNVLIVDDDRINLALFSHLLEDIPDTTIFGASDPAHALDWCREHETDLLLLDYMMPDMNGFAFLEQFRLLSGQDHVPVIMISTDAKTTVRHAALELSANDFLTKPVNKVELRSRVCNMLNLRKSQLRQSGLARSLECKVQEADEKMQQNEQATAGRLATAAQYRDPETGAHLLRMAGYARLAAANLGLSVEEQNDIHDAAPLHDIGKIGIPDHILLKPGRLDDAEMQIMRTHPLIGAQILKDGNSKLMRNASVIALTHHEKFDGSGYPHGLKGKDIPLYGRLVAVADVFDALTSSRPYKAAWSIERATGWLRQNAGSHFDPDCVEALLRDMGQIHAILNAHKDEDIH
ncbi:MULTISPECIES: HD domain-containing phosphohydrolase [unclassified Herbaspirillum]|uniref:response regulator n=1 Tax=unclassified Herbaspirillum TaxID=2624150 RepID=UPI00383BEC5A